MTIDKIFIVNLPKVWDWAEIGLATPRSAVRHVSAVRNFTDCVSLPGAQFVKIPVYGFTFSVVFDSLLIVTPIV